MKKIITSSRFLLPVGLLCLSCSWQVSSFVPQYSRHNQPVSFSSTTSHYDRKIELQMGLRDFLSKKARRKDNDEPPEKPAKKIPIKQTVEVPKSKLSTPPSPPKKAPPTQPQKRVRMGEDDDGNLNVDSLGPETVQQRIARFKRGEMSPEEKEAYLKSALSTGSTPESRLPMTQSHSRNDSTAQKPSPFPADSILRNMARGGKPPSEDYPLNKSDAQSKKQKYLDMVTDPHRFDKYKSSGSGASNIQQSPPVPAPAPTPIRQEIPPPPPAPANNDAQNNQINAPMDLGARLGAHAMEAEKRNAELRKQQEEKEQQLEEQRREREKLLAEAQKQRQEEMARREAEVMRRRRKKETEMAKNQEEKIKQEKVRQTQLLKAQEDYWTRKLAENKKHAEMKEEDKKATEVTAAKSKGKEDAAAQAERAPEQEEEKEEEKPAPEPPRRYSDNNLINRAASEVFGTQNLNDVPHPRDKVRDQERKKTERERQQEQYMERLKSLNSPLPKKVDKPKDKPVRKAPFEPQRPVNARSQSPAQSLGELTKTIRNPIPSMPKSDDPSEDIPPLLRPKARKPADEQSASTRFSWFGGGKKDQVEEEPSEPAPAPVPAPSPAPAARSIPSPPPAPKAAPPKPKREPVRERKGPIRMQLPLGDEEEDEPLLTEGMTIGEIMKRRNAESGDQGARSKKWGVDMSRFQD